MAIRNRMIFWMVLGLMLIAALAFAFWPRAVEADMARVENGPLSVTIDEEGETRVKDVFVVSAPVSGELERVILEPGDRVVTGQTRLTAIRPASSPVLDQRTEAQLRASVQAARSAVSMTESDIERLTVEYGYAVEERDRLRPLYERDYISKAAFDKAVATADASAAALHSAESGLRMRRSELQMARSALMPRMGQSSDADMVELKSVIDGVVLQVTRESEGLIVQGTPILSIGDPDDIEVVVDLLSEDAVVISPGDPAIISGWGGEALSGRVRLIEPFAFTKVSALGIEEQRVNVIIDLETPEAAERLGHGYRVDVAIVTWQAEGILSVPMTALFKQGNDWTVFAVRDGRAVLQRVEIGHLDGRRAEVLDGLQAGDQVIEHPSDRISDAVRVKDRSKI